MLLGHSQAFGLNVLIIIIKKIIIILIIIIIIKQQNNVDTHNIKKEILIICWLFF